MKQLTRAWPFAILAIGGYFLPLPDYGRVTAIQVAHGVFLDEAMLIAYLGLLAVGWGLRPVTVRKPALQLSLLVATLGAMGMVSAAVNQYSLRDFGEAGRLLVLAAYLFVAVRWAADRGPTFLLRSFLFGIVAGGLVNLYYSITDPQLVLFGLPILRSENGAGGLLALGISLGAWLKLLARTRGDSVVAVAAGLVGIVAAALSHSKTAMTIGACGAAAWLCVVTTTIAARRLRAIVLVGFLAVGATGVYVSRAADPWRPVVAVWELVANKFVSVDITQTYSIGGRYMYMWGVAEILVRHPIAGVSYSGFYDAITQTSTYKSGLMVSENAEAGSQGISNPHNSFLYYAAANGLPGLLLSIAIFAAFVRELWRNQALRGLSGVGLWASLSLAYFIYGMTLPTLFGTEILYVPAAAAICSARAVFVRQAARRHVGLPALPARPVS